MKPTSLFLLLVSCSAILFPAVSLADELPDSKLFDKNGDGHLDQAELDIYSLHVQDKRFRDWDKNRDGKIEMNELAGEIQKANDAAPKIIEQQRLMAANNASAFQVDLSQPITGEEADEVLRISRPRPKYQPGWFRLRGKVSDFSVNPPKGNVEKISPAIVSWSRDFVADGETWTARGAIGGFWKNSWSDLSLGAEFDRLGIL